MQKQKRLAVFGVGIIGTGNQDEGIPAMVSGLAELASRKEYLITVYSFIPVDKDRAPALIRVRCISKLSLNLRIRYILLMVRFVFDHLRNPYDLLHAQSPYPAGMVTSWLSRFFKIPWILSLHAGETIEFPEVPFGDLLVPHLKKAAVKTCNDANVLTALSKYQADITIKNLALNRDLVILHRGVFVPDFSEKSLTTPVQFIHISNYHPIKDYETLLKTFSIVSSRISCELKIIGIDYDAKVIEMIDSMNLNGKVKMVGYIPNNQVSSLFATAHILLHTSIYESQAMVVLEAMAHGVVVCGTRVGMMADLSDLCITAPSRDYLSLADEIIELQNDEVKYHSLRSAAYQWVKSHDLQWHVNEMEKLYARTITNQNHL